MHLVQKYFECRGIQVDDLNNLLSHSFEQTKWPGRCQTVPDPKHPCQTWFLDGAHTLESLDCCVEWFVDPATAVGLPIGRVWTIKEDRFTRFNSENG